MNISKIKYELENTKLREAPIESYPKDKNKSLCYYVPIIILVICICIFSFISYIVYNKINDKYQSQLKEKDNEIQNIKEQLKSMNSQLFTSQKSYDLQKANTEIKLIPIEKEYLYDKTFYMSYSMYSPKDNKGNGNGYSIIMNTHTLEKALSHFILRPFGKARIEKIIELLEKQLSFENYERLFSFINGINSLRKYKKIYEDNNWTAKQEYKVVSNFLTKFEKIKEQNTGAFILTKEELKQDYDIDYKKFIKSRHSTRNYKNQQLEIEDIKKAIDMAKYSASSCNRQYIKLHYYPKGKMRQNVIDYSIGKGGLYLKGVNTFILTFDANGLSGPGERNQGYFNAGLFATNFVNALHSLGIGTCFIQFGNSVEEEEKLKELNNIPINERITVILFAGYYDEKSIFCISPRKDLEDYITLHE
jgi:nitroreductase